MDDPLEKIKKDLAAFEAKHSSELEDVNALSKKLLDASGEIEQSWSGSFAGWHGRMYFHGFQKPSLNERFSGEWGGIHGIPDGWEEKDNAAVVQKISELVGDGFSPEKLEERIDSLRTAIDDFKNEVDASISLLDSKAIAKEQSLVDELEKFSLGNPKVDYVNNHLPKTVMTRDMEALRQGTTIASWLYYAAAAYEGIKTVEAFTAYKKQVDRFVRQVAARSSRPAAASTTHAIHPDIQGKCMALYDSGAYSEAVERSFKVVRDRLRTLTGYETGSEAFGKGRLHIRGAAAENVDADFNQGAKFLMMGIDMFRNEKSHTSDAQIDDPIRAYQYLVVSSLALYLLDNSEITP